MCLCTSPSPPPLRYVVFLSTSNGFAVRFNFGIIFRIETSECTDSYFIIKRYEEGGSSIIILTASNKHFYLNIEKEKFNQIVTIYLFEYPITRVVQCCMRTYLKMTNNSISNIFDLSSHIFSYKNTHIPSSQNVWLLSFTLFKNEVKWTTKKVLK